MRCRWVIGLCAVVGGLLITAPHASVQNLYLAGWVVPSETNRWHDWLQNLAAKLEAREVALRGAPSQVAVVSLAELGFQVDAAHTLARLEASPCAPRSGVKRDVFQNLIAPFSECPDVPVVWRFDANAAAETLERLNAALSAPAIDAVVNFANRERVMHEWGYELDFAKSVAQVATINASVDSEVTLALNPVQPRVQLSQLTSVDPTKLLASYQTDFRTKRGPRVHNIRQAARYLDGAILEPGATLSFNRRVGVRTAARGFIDAPVIVNDEMESGMGGGVCQLATTLHGAAIFGALEVKERRSHSRPSGYAPLGLDATVIDGVQDLKLRNPYDVPLRVRAYLPSKYVVRVELVGSELLGEVSHKYWVLQRHDYARRIVEKSELAPGTVKRSQKGGYGYDTVSRVVLTREDGSRHERRYQSKYYPVPEVLWVGPGTRAEELPPLAGGIHAPGDSVL